MFFISASVSAQDPQYFQFTSNTGYNATVFVPIYAQVSVDGEPLVNGDEIGVFTPEGLCVGAVVWRTLELGAISITIWGDNDQTDIKDGLAVGDSLFYRVWRQSTNTEYPNIEVTYDPNPLIPNADRSGRYNHNRWYVISRLSSFPEPAAPSLVSPTDDQTSVPLQPRLEWQSVARADVYNLQIADNPEFSPIFKTHDSLTNTHLDIEDLDFATTYYWRVNATNLAGTGAWSQTWNFTTLERFIELENPSGPLIWRARSTQTIRWTSRGIDRVRLEYSLNNSGQWILIADSVDADDEQYSWEVPDTSSTQARLRITDIDDPEMSVTSDLFTISPEEIQITISMPFGNPSATSSYRMIGLPGDGTIPLADIMTGNPGTDWNAFFDTGDTDDYLVEYDGSSTFRFRPGRGFWVLSRNPIQYTNREDAVSLRNDNTYNISLHRDWNIISNPFEIPVSWEAVRTANNLSESDPIWSYTGIFSQSETFEPYRGYYFYNRDNRSSLSIPYPGGAAAPDTTSSESVVTTLVRLSLEKNEMRYADVQFGTVDRKRTDADRYHIPAPPSDFEEATLRIMQPGGKRKHHTFIGLESDDGYEVDLYIEVPVSGAYALTIGREALAEDHDMLLVNLHTGKKISLTDRDRIQLSSETGSERYRLLLGSAEFIRAAAADLLPAEVTLSRNYPNPFNPYTTIEYSIPADRDNAHVTLEIFNALGQRVRTLVYTNQAAGVYSVQWDARNDQGTNVPSGIYIYRLRTGDTILAKRMVLLK